MIIRSLLVAGALVASVVFPRPAGAQVQIRAGVQVVAPSPPTVVIARPQPQVVVVQQPPQTVYVAQPQVQPVYVRRPRRGVVIVTPQGAVVRQRGRRGRGGRWHR